MAKPANCPGAEPIIFSPAQCLLSIPLSVLIAHGSRDHYFNGNSLTPSSAENILSICKLVASIMSRCCCSVPSIHVKASMCMCFAVMNLDVPFSGIS